MKAEEKNESSALFISIELQSIFFWGVTGLLFEEAYEMLRVMKPQ